MSTTSNPNLILTELEVSNLLKIKPQTLRIWRCKGVGPKFIKLGSSVRYQSTVIEDYLAGATRSSTSELGD